MIDPHNIQELLGALGSEIAALRSRVRVLEAMLRTHMALSELLGLDPTGDPVDELRVKMAQRVAEGLAPPIPLKIAMEVWPGAWTEDDDTLTLVLADPSSLISAEIEAVHSATWWRVRINNRSVWSLLAKDRDLAEALIIARGKTRKMLEDLTKGVGL